MFYSICVLVCRCILPQLQADDRSGFLAQIPHLDGRTQDKPSAMVLRRVKSSTSDSHMATPEFAIHCPLKKNRFASYSIPILKILLQCYNMFCLSICYVVWEYTLIKIRNGHSRLLLQAHLWLISLI